VSSFRERNDRPKPGGKPFSKPGKGPRPDRAAERSSDRPTDSAKPWTPVQDEGLDRPVDTFRGRPSKGPRRRHPDDWLWGWHAVQAALANPRREGFKRLLVTPARARDVEDAAARLGMRVERMELQDIARALPSGAVHQGVALLADPIEPESIESFGENPHGVLLMLDQLTDPQNVGAVFRSAAAFGARGLILQDRHAPALTGALAKASAGAIETVPHARVVNLSRALEQLTDAGWRTVGLDGEAKETLEQAMNARPTVLVLGSEGEGLRRLVAEHCDTLARIPMPGGFESLNVSAAAAVALYEASKPRG
jgi:23S rRNA (guanosine2251-2'-O)-methyltransferase